jgi:hypothetical protein
VYVNGRTSFMIILPDQQEHQEFNLFIDHRADHRIIVKVLSDTMRACKATATAHILIWPHSSLQVDSLSQH